MQRQQTPSQDFPWWLLATVLIGVFVAIVTVSNDLYSQIFVTIGRGLGVTVRVTLIAFFLSSAVGLAVALMVLSNSIIVRQIGRFYVEIFRGLPVLVLLFWVAFVGAPALVWLWNWVTAPLQTAGWTDPALVRDFSLEWRAIIALTFAYSSFLAEIFRAGIQAVESGQVEAAKALGLSRYQCFRLVVWPQAFRTIFPPYASDFIAMVKDSSLVSVLGVADITQLAKIYSAGSFRYFETYSMLAFIYLILTIGLSLFLRRVERRMREQRTTAPEH